jgi:hypothetical protein
MSTIIERDSDSSGPAGMLVFLVVIVLMAAGAWFAYTHGVFDGRGGRNTTIENNKTVVMPAPASAPETPKP